jgi:hypothetical protein
MTTSITEPQPVFSDDRAIFIADLIAERDSAREDARLYKDLAVLALEQIAQLTHRTRQLSDRLARVNATLRGMAQRGRRVA